jgi:hypothetical protein
MAGYLLVRYSSNPAAADDPNVNGIYAIGNTIPGTVTGTVVYQGTATSFTNTTLTPATQYWYKLYTYDKAYNYSSEIIANGITLAPFPFVNGDYRPSINGTDFSFDGTWEVYSGGSWMTGQIAPQNITPAARPNRIIIDRPGIGGASSSANTYKNIIVTNGGELLLSDNAIPVAEFISSGNTLEVQRGGILILSGQVNLNSSANIIVRSGAHFTLNNTNIGNAHGFWGGSENFEKGSHFTILNHSSSVAGSSSLMNTYAQIT